MSPIRLTTVALFASLSLASPVRAQQANGDSLPVTRCDAATNTCTNEARSIPPASLIGPSGRTTVLSAGGRAPEAVLEGGEEQVWVPGCGQLSPGTLLCTMIQDYQHCRTLMISSMVDSCRIEVAFSSGVIQAREAVPGSFDLTVESEARVLIKREERGFGEVRNSAAVTLRFDVPVEAATPAWCVQRDRYLYYATGPDGGLAEIEDSADCDVPLTFRFRAHADDLMRAWDLCDTFAAWGEDIEDSIEILAAAIFHIRSATPEFSRRYPDGVATIAPFVTVKAPLTIECRG